jgi:flagellar hook-basal body complex protein FliE
MAKTAGTASSVSSESSVAAPGSRFGDLLSEMVQKTDAGQKASAATTGALLSGQNVPLHQVMIASEEASVSFQLMLEVRNKLLDGYQELMRMQV